MDYQDPRGQSANAGVLSMTTASSNGKQKRIASTGSKYTHTLPSSSEMEKQFPHFGVSPNKETYG